MNKGSKSNADNMSYMFVVLDINKNYIQAAIMDEQGSIGRGEGFKAMYMILRNSSLTLRMPK